MSLAIEEVERLTLPAINTSRLHYDEAGIDWDCWRATPLEEDHGDYHVVDMCLTDGHHHGPIASRDIAPRDGWRHHRSCTCELSERCMEGR